jgi:HEPN domain-containing protein
MNRSDLQRLAGTRIREAKALFRAGEHSGAYYLAGYAVECALKACYAKSVKRHDFPDKTAKQVFTHSLSELVVLAGLKKELDSATRLSSRLAASWNVAYKWTEESRYSVWTKNDAEAILDAINGRKDGVLPWIKQRW